jgi:hypothetical protein
LDLLAIEEMIEQTKFLLQQTEICGDISSRNKTRLL